MLRHLIEQATLPCKLVAIYSVTVHTKIPTNSIIKRVFAAATWWCRCYTFTTVRGNEWKPTSFTEENHLKKQEKTKETKQYMPT